jgi:3-hydroxybutyryl-CoA dehydrogenase
MGAEPLLKSVAICGAGQMGAAAAVCFQRAGYDVLLWLRNPDRVPSLRNTLKEMDRFLDEHVGSAEQAGSPIEVTLNLDLIDERAELVMDAIAEDMQQKVDLFRRLPHAVVRRAIFITTTSGLSITEMGQRAGCCELLAGTHFWNPPHLMPLVEVVRSKHTPSELIDRVCAIVRSIGKIPVRVERDVPGFIGNRLLHAMWREAINLVQRGIASPEDVDRVARLTFGLRLAAVGPLENMDLVGLDLVHTIHQYLLRDLADSHEPLEILARHVQAGKLGIRSTNGFYDWTQRDPGTLVERRDRQIVHQLKFLAEMDAL